ncbi:MAG: alpha/beta hydrolase [Leifsonia sp.]
MPHLAVPGGSLHWESDGHASAPALLLIHAGIANLRMWDPLVPFLAVDHLVIRFDTRGFGQTEFDDTAYSNRADAIAVLDHLGVRQATLVGASRGGSIAIDVALEHPERVSGLVVIGSGPSGFPEVELTPREDAMLDAIDAAEAQGDWERVADLETGFWDVGPLRETADVDPAFLRLARELNRSNIRHASRAVEAIPLEPTAYERIDDIAVPALVVVGEYDITPALAQYEFLVDRIPDATGAIFHDSAHLPSLERADEFLHVLQDWLGDNDL